MKYALVIGIFTVGLLGSVQMARCDPARSYAIVDTGQTRRFDEMGAVDSGGSAPGFAGQDADYSGNQPSYSDGGDGTITDNVTGLMWEKGYRATDWAGAEQAARAADTGGYSDWRVPTIKELYSLIDFSGAQGRGAPESNTVPADAVPFIDTSVFDFAYPAEGRYIDAQFATATVYTALVMDSEKCFFGVNFADGRIKCYPLVRQSEAGQYNLRLVRGNPDYGKNTFTPNPDGTVTDSATGLMWTAVDSGDPSLGGASEGAFTWQEALELAGNSTYAGHDDWRLPNAKELHSIVDYGRSPDATGTAAVDPVFVATPIKNADGQDDFPAYWTSTSFEPGADAVSFYFGRALGYFRTPGHLFKQFVDVHGAGAQRTNPKSGKDSYGSGPQGDVRTVRNYVRLVRNAE